jgi:hypothetical protein
VSFAAITLFVASQRVFIVVYFVMTQSGNFWVHPRTYVVPRLDVTEPCRHILGTVWHEEGKTYHLTGHTKLPVVLL